MVRSKTNRVITKALYHVVCLLLCVVMLYPLLWMVFSSFKDFWAPVSERFLRTACSSLLWQR